ncbi:restriction endonuclease subunit S [Limosilactobacillus reuteri]|uniref:restriction endonuclease subunit S n=1 Tax=Limosilactobacillus reuteri TaxID=1598 RepID=UPI000DEB2B0B|nr:restriction endonuclease subunit S [Limosilactobacillus reuteri]AXX73516.1 restriction endonuclease subunit S [Limosilactobacillus reuteri]
MDKKPEKLVPEVRFKGFTDDWEQHKLGEISERILRKNSDLQSLLPLTISAQDGLVDQTIYFNKQVASKQLKNYLLLYNGDFAYNKSYSVGYPYGAIKRLDKYKQGVLSTLYIAFKPTNINSDFLQHYYDTDKWYREIYRNAAEGARNHGLLNISANDFFNSKLITPSDNDEQLKIAKIINVFNRLITLQQRKLEQLMQLKKAMLQQLFVDKNCKQPILRFKNFNDNWEERKLSDIANYRNGKAHEQYIDMNGIYTVVNSKFISTNGKVKKFSNKPIELLKKGEIAFVLSDVPNGKALAKAYLIDSDNRYSLNQRIAGITPSSDINSYFLYILINRNRYFLKFDDGVGQTNLSKKDIEEFKENYPLFDEQQKIANLFSKIQILITLQQNKLTQLTTLKEYLLRKLFI